MYNLSLKTRLLNKIRHIFTVPLIEHTLVFLNLSIPNLILKKLIPSHYLYKENSIRKVTRFGTRMDLDISHVVDHSVYFGFKDSNYKNVLTDIKKASVILDIGANIGTSSLYFSSINPQATIVAFEPHPDTYQRALVNLNYNNEASIFIQNYGLGSSPGFFKMYELHSNNPGMNRILTSTTDLPYKTIEVRTLDSQIDSITNGSVDFVKIDVEGFEKEVLLGATHILSKFHPVLFIELDDNNLKQNGSSAIDLIEFLKQYNYVEFVNSCTDKVIDFGEDLSNCHFDLIAR